MNHDDNDHSHHGHGTRAVEAPPISNAVVDPVCGMTVDPDTAAGSVTYSGTTHYFCSRHCQQKFEAGPEKYIEPTPASRGVSCCGAEQGGRPAASTSAIRKSSEIHLSDAPEVIRDGPGSLSEVRHGVGAGDAAARRH